MIEAHLYPPIFFNMLLILTLLSVYQLMTYSSSFRIYLYKEKNEFWAWIFVVFLAIFIGFRPISGVFVDMTSYARVYENAKYIQEASMLYQNSDVVFNTYMFLCAKVMPFSFFTFLTEAVYVILPLLAIRRLFPNNVWVAYLMYVSAFSFFGYATNGIQNGMAVAVFIFALSQIKRKWLFSILLFVSVGLHNSMLLPVFSLLCNFFYKNSKTYLILWLVAIPLAFIGGGFFENVFSSLGFDDRMNRYLNPEENLDHTSGLRLDFLLYSSIPILVGYYVIFVREITSKYYTLLLNTYTLSNTFWVLIIQVSFGYRFAYLSWFLYPLVLLYPFLRLPLFQNQHLKVALILFLHFAFTYFMWIKG